MKKTIRDFNLENKKVIIRVDYNVPIQNGKITDFTRIDASLKTIEYAIENKAKVILLSHLGRIKTEEDKTKNDLKIVYEALKERVNTKVTFIPSTRGEAVEQAIEEMKPKEIILLQNTRYEDIPDKKESKNDPSLGKYWASLGDIFINDAFGTSHRSHASNVGIATYLPSGMGFLIEEEINQLNMILEKPSRPFTVILGGAKVSDKIGVIENFAQKADYILIGGGMAYTFLKAAGFAIGSSLLDKESIPFAQKMLDTYPDKIILPIDSINAKEIKEDTMIQETLISDFKEEEIGLDIGSKTAKVFGQYLTKSKTILWNGPLGYTEIALFQNGTKRILEILKESDAVAMVGGGDTVSIINALGYQDIFTHISTGGGASLELLEGKELPGISKLSDHE